MYFGVTYFHYVQTHTLTKGDMYYYWNSYPRSRTSRNEGVTDLIKNVSLSIIFGENTYFLTRHRSEETVEGRSMTCGTLLWRGFPEE